MTNNNLFQSEVYNGIFQNEASNNIDILSPINGKLYFDKESKEMYSFTENKIYNDEYITINEKLFFNNMKNFSEYDINILLKKFAYIENFKEIDNRKENNNNE